jgi:two-component system, sensor histidine kinase and response regulator
MTSSSAERSPEGRRWLAAPLVLCAAVAALTALAVRQQVVERIDNEARQLEAVAELRANQVADWLQNRLDQAAAVARSKRLAALYARWRDQADPAARELLADRLAEMQQAYGHRFVAVTDHEGRIVLGEGAAPGLTAQPLRDAVLRALASGSVQHTGLYGRPANEPGPPTSQLDVVAPLVGGGMPARAAIVMRTDAAATLLPHLQRWPGRSHSAATLLVRRNGDMLVGAFGRNLLPLSTPELLAARAIRGEEPFAQAFAGEDFRGVPVLGVVRPVLGSDWYLVTKVDRAELGTGALAHAAWIGVAGLLAAAGIWIGAWLLRERRALVRSRSTQAEQQAQLQSLALMQAISDGSSDAIFAKDLEGRYLVCNREAARLMGHPAEAVIGVDDRALFPPEQAEMLIANDARVMAENRTHTYEERLTTSRGELTFLATKGPLHDEQGRVVGLFGISRDVTERMHEQQALRESETTVRALLAAMVDGMFVAQDRRFVFANPALTRLLGYTEAEFVGLPFSAVVGPRALPLWTERFDQHIAGGADPDRAFELQMLRKDGRPLWVELRASRFHYRERPAILGLVSDISERNRIAKELDQHRHRLQELVDQRTQQLTEANAELLVSRDRAEAANRAKSAFLANMSHEIRTPLNAIIGLTHLMRRDAPHGPAAERLRKVAEAASHLLQVINDILDLSKIEAGRLDLEVIDFSLQALLAGVRTLVSERAQAKGLALRVDAPPDLPDALRGDPTRLSQALLNLLSNAIKFTERGSVELRVQRLAEDEQTLTLRFTVKDTGIGIRPEQKQALFDAFAQGDTSMTRRFGGTGLGLAITQRLAQAMHGDVGVDSQPGAGSEFWFSARLERGRSAPAADEAASPAYAEAALRRHAAGARVLLVEDNPVNQDVAQELLQAAGLQVELAANGVEAVQLAQQRPHDLILMDVQMPEMDGLEATRRIRALLGAARTPIIAMTANAFGDEREACLKAGMDDHVAKPVDPAELYTVLMRWLPAPARRISDSAPRHAGP